MIDNNPPSNGAVKIPSEQEIKETIEQLKAEVIKRHETLTANREELSTQRLLAFESVDRSLIAKLDNDLARLQKKLAKLEKSNCDFW